MSSFCTRATQNDPARPILGVKLYIGSFPSLRAWNELFHVENSHPVLTLIALRVKRYPKTLDDFLCQKLPRPICHFVEVSICTGALHSSVTTAVSELTLTECSPSPPFLIAYSALNEFSSHSAAEVSDLPSHLRYAHLFWLHWCPPTQSIHSEDINLELF